MPAPRHSLVMPPGSAGDDDESEEAEAHEG
jgi:hypothetical protein